jgi:hypothetical protein
MLLRRSTRSKNHFLFDFFRFAFFSGTIGSVLDLALNARPRFARILRPFDYSVGGAQ